MVWSSPTKSTASFSNLTKNTLGTISSLTLLDSYSETNYDYTYNIGYQNDNLGQSFQGIISVIDSVKFYLQKTGSPTGYVYAQLWSVSGGKPSVLLATSDGVDVSTISGTIGLVTFNFSGSQRYLMSASTYFITCYFASTGSSVNYLKFGIDNSSGTHSGSFAYRNIGYAWNAWVGDSIFYVYVDSLWENKTKNSSSSSNPAKSTTTFTNQTKNTTSWNNQGKS